MSPDLNAKVGRLATGVVRLADDVEALAATVIVEKDWRRRFTVVAAIGAVLIAGLVVVLIVLALGNRKLLAKFDECTNPGTKAHPHACYDKAQAQTAAVIGQIREGNEKAAAYAVECVIGGRADVEKCVEERFAGGPAPAAVTAAESAPITTPTPTPTSTTATTSVQRSSAPAPLPLVPTTAAATTTSTIPPSAPAPPTTIEPTPPPTVNPCSLDLKVFCLGLSPSTPNCPSVAGMCLPTVQPKGT